ncbi:MAG: hypothetical protein ACKO6F_09675 [Cyanobium sp.]
MKRFLVLLLVALVSYQAGRLSERAIWPCRLRPVASLLEPLLGRPLPGRELCDLLLKIPSL